MGVVRNGHLIFSKGYGWADVGRRRPNTSRTNFDLASVSKQFTATTVLLQAEKGRLNLRDPLGKYIAGLPAYASRAPLENLLNMTSGLPDYDDSEPVQLSDLVDQLKGDEPGFKPGERYEYLNMNYALLTFVVQKVSAQDLGTVMQREIFAPLRMSRTSFLNKRGQNIEDRAVGYVKKGKDWAVSRNDVPGVGDGNVFSNVEDLSLWAADLLRGSSRIPSSLGQAWTSGRTLKGKPTGYGYGFEIDTHGGQKRISHSVSWNGTSTYISLYPKVKLAVIVLSNREDEDAYCLGEQVEDLFLKER